MRALASLAAEAEAGGWDGFFIWDHLSPVFSPGMCVPTADTTVALTAIVLATERLRVGAMIHPLPRRRPQKFARELATLDVLSGGRMVCGVGLGVPAAAEFEAFGEDGSVARRARLLDESLDVVAAYWSGERVDYDGSLVHVHSEPLLPTPLQRPRIPVWVAARWPGSAGPFARAARWDGVFPIAPDPMNDFVRPDDIAAVRAAVGRGDEFDIVVNGGWGVDSREFEAAGATWLIDTAFTRDEAMARAKEGPPR